MSRLPRLVRPLHTGGRQTPYPNQGGAGLASTIPPSMSTTVPPHSSVPSPSPTTLPPPTPTITSSDTSLEPIESIVPTELSTPRPPAPPEFTAKGRLIPRRPRRTVPVTLPSGHPEPPSYPPPPTYFQQVENLLDIKPHPLWQFFHPTSAAKSMLSKEIASPPAGGFGSVETVDSNPDVLLRSGVSSPPGSFIC
jgi:hypothetical protein